MVDNNVSREALLKATETSGRLDAHEKAHEREFQAANQFQSEMRGTHTRLEGSIRRVHDRIDVAMGRWFTVGGTVIFLLLAIIGALLTRGLPWQ